MNLGAALAAGGIGLTAANNYNRQADEDAARLQAQDLATQRAKIVNEGLGQEVTEKGRLMKEAEADRRTEAEFAASRSGRLFGTGGAPVPAAGGVVAAPPPGTPAPAGIGPAGGVVASAQPMAGKGKAGPAPMGELDDYRDLYEIAKKNGSTKGMRAAVEGVAGFAQAQFARGLEQAGAAFELGDTRPLVELYNSRYPNGHKIASIERTPDGGAIVTPMGQDGKPGQPVQQSPEDLRAALTRLTDKDAWLKMSEEAFKQGHMTKRELAVQKAKGADDLAKQAASDTAAGERNAATNKAHIASAGISAGATLGAAKIRAETDKSAAKEGSVQERVKVTYGVIDKALGANDMGGMTGENAALIVPAKRLAAKYLEAGMDPGAAAEKALAEARAEVKSGGMKVPVPGGAGGLAIDTKRFGF